MNDGSFSHEAHGLTRWRPRLPLPPTVPATIPALLDRQVRAAPEREAVITSDGPVSFAQLAAAVHRAEAVLSGMGLRRGDRIAAALRNELPIVVAFLAAQHIGAIWVGVPRALAPTEKAFILSDCGASLLLMEADLAESMRVEAASIPSLSRVVSVGGPADEWGDLLRDAPVSVEGGRPAVDPLDAAAISYTSGTTGFPKGAVHSQHNMLVVVASNAVGPGPTVARQGVMNPMTSLNNMISGILNPLYGGNCAVLLSQTDSLSVGTAIAAEGIGSIHGSISLYHDLLARSDLGHLDLSSLVQPFVGGSEIPTEVIDGCRDRIGSGITIGYGMTEAPMAVAWAAPAAGHSPGRVGRPAPHVDLTVVGSNGATLPVGEIGEVCVQPAATGPLAGVYTPMLGYWNRPQDTEDALRDGVYHTGDLGFLDEFGELHLAGRRKELILRGGGNVYPAEVERVLRLHPSVSDVTVFGVPDARLGERVAAAVVPTDGAHRDDVTARLLERCEDELAPFKIPDAVVIVDEIPRNAMGKPMKAQLVEEWRSAGSRLVR